MGGRPVPGPVHVAVDLGASSGRVIAGVLDAGRLRTWDVARFPNGPVPVAARGRDLLHWDILALWDGIREGLRVAARDCGPVVSVGIDGWAVDYGLLDGDGELLGAPVHYRDDRTAGVSGQVFGRVSAAELYARTGTQTQPFNTVFQLVAEGDSRRLAVADRLLLVPDLLGYWLTGAEVTELTNASTTGLLDATTRTWDPVALSVVGDITGTDVGRLLAPLVGPGTVVAPLRPSLAAELGLDGTELVAVGSHDTASAVAAVPMVDPGSAAYISSGTWSLVGLELDAPVLTSMSREMNFTNELGVDGTVRYLRNVAGLWLLSESLRTWRDRGDSHDLEVLLAEAAAVEPLRCVVDVDDPVFSSPGDMPTRIAEVAARTGQPVPVTPAGTTRCILDSLALAYRRALRQAAELTGHRIEVVHLVGGGARNTLLAQLTADATGLPVVAGPAEGAALGNLLVQARATGALPGGLSAIREVVRASVRLSRVEPSSDRGAWARAEERVRAEERTRG